MKIIQILRKIPAVAVMLGIFILSSLPGNDPLLHSISLHDKIEHVFAYFILGMSICLWISNEKWFAKPVIWGVVVVIICSIFGISDEYHQTFVPGRSGNDLGDIIADIIGGFCAPVIYLVAVYVWRKHTRLSSAPTHRQF